MSPSLKQNPPVFFILFSFYKIKQLNHKWPLRLSDPVCVCVCISIYVACVSDEPLPHFMAPPIPSSPWPSSYQFDWMICNMSPLIWFGATVGVSGSSQLLPPPGVWGGGGAGGCVGMDTGAEQMKLVADEIMLKCWWEVGQEHNGQRESTRNTSGERETGARTGD